MWCKAGFLIRDMPSLYLTFTHKVPCFIQSCTFTYCLEVLWHDIFRYLKKRYYDMNIRPICVVQTSDITCQILAIVTAHMRSFFPAPQASSLLKHVTGTASLQGHADSLLDASVRHFSSAPSAQSASTEENGYAVLFSYLELSHSCVLYFCYTM